MDHYNHFVDGWLKLDESARIGSTGKGIRATINTAWFLLQDEQDKIPKDRRPEAIFKGYKT